MNQPTDLNSPPAPPAARSFWLLVPRSILRKIQLRVLSPARPCLGLMGWISIRLSHKNMQSKENHWGLLGGKSKAGRFTEFLQCFFV